jgi:hypothetical protein
MSKIEQFARQHETFNPTNKKHREIFHNVLKHKTWGRSPIRFWLEDETTSLMDQCTKNMARYYMEQEFGNINELSIGDELAEIDNYRQNRVINILNSKYK